MTRTPYEALNEHRIDPTAHDLDDKRDRTHKTFRRQELAIQKNADAIAALTKRFDHHAHNLDAKWGRVEEDFKKQAQAIIQISDVVAVLNEQFEHHIHDSSKATDDQSATAGLRSLREEVERWRQKLESPGVFNAHDDSQETTLQGVVDIIDARLEEGTTECTK